MEFRGNVDTVILKVLFEGDRYGYDMIKQINARSGGQWEIKQATFYACLKKLEKQGFVTSYWDASESNGGRRKYYTLTDSGREVFVSYKNEWERSRDLFGELITDDDPILPADDFSDVEDDDYAVPKRRSQKPRAKKAKPEPAPEIKYDPPAYDSREYALALGGDNTASAEQPAPPAQETTDDTATFNVLTAAEDTASDASDVSDTVETNADGVITEKTQEYVQQSMFDAYSREQSDGGLTDGELDEDETENLDGDAQYVDDAVYDQAPPQPVAAEDEKIEPTADPRAIIDELYAATYTGNRSYADARKAGNAHAETHDDKTAIAPVASTAVQPVTPAAPAVAETDTALQPYGGGLPGASEESPARKAYKDILGDLIERSEARTEAEKSARAAEREEESAAAADAGAVSRFDDVRQSMSELGNNVVLREHDDAPKQYAHKYHYYSNRLMMTHYTVMCAVMFMLGLVTFLTFFFGMGMRMKYDYLLYMGAGLLPIILFIAAVIGFAGEPDKTKRINVNFRFSIIIRVVIMVQVAVIIYCVNLIWGMPVSFSAEYLPSLIIPLVYALFIPVSEVIFMTLLKSGRYAV